MTRKDYKMLAEIIDAVRRTGGDTGTLLAVVERLREPLTQDNPRFDFARFGEACGFTGML